ncbi:DUF3397 family protein [Psychrobacillus vulpis]|uniref:DUF3397 domain-containing protein n=1 Tax=Psychrobacillus vulpis TaxID=2325572 RepID=A0A544TK42_9BACI|nr:DUF3397 domain-containing protein [Psychrobacillus vulpis]
MIVIIKILSIFLVFPFLLFLLTFLISKYLLHKRKKSFGIAADVTTLILFFSVSNAVSVLFSKNILFSLIIMSLIIATIFTYFDWRTEKEIEIIPLLRKIWRSLFLLLCIAYALIWIIGVIRYVLYYIS